MLHITAVKTADRDLIKSVHEKLKPPPKWVKPLESLLSLLPRQWVAVTLLPEGDVATIDADQGEWEATGPDPRFTIKWAREEIRPGWYYLETALARQSGSRVAKLYVDFGKGMSEDTCVRIPSNLRGSIREVLYLSKGVEALRWDPNEAVGRFTQSALIIHRISWLESYCRRAARVLYDRFCQKQKIHEPIWITLRNLSFKLQHAYLESAERRLGRVEGIDYENFLRINDTLSDADKQAIEKQVPTLPLRPVISIIMPVFDPPREFLRQALDSVLAQLYPHWELCIADDASTQPEVRQILEHYRLADPRVKVTYRDVNGHISRASNSALELATGEFIALMDQDDLIPAQALYHVAVEINRFPRVDLIYSDEDKVNASGARCDPYFKPDWNPDLFYSHNLVTHLGVYRMDLVRKIGGFRVGFDGAQDYDLALRMVRVIQESHIRHIPRLLYHWRIHSESTAAAGTGAKLYAYTAARNALNDHLAAKGGLVESGPFMGSYRAKYPISEPLPLVSLIIPTRDRLDVLQSCIESIKKKTSYPNWEILIVDNQSIEASTLFYLDQISLDPRIRVLKYDAPFNYSAINNFAVSHAKGSIIGLLNNDVEVIEGAWLEEMVSHALRPEIGAVGAKLLYPDGRIQHSGVILGLGGLAAHAHRFFDRESPGYCGHAKLIKNYSAVTAACLIVRKSIYQEIGGLDEINLKVAYNDVDFCLRIKEAGYRNLYTPYAVLYHHESVSRGHEDTEEKRARFAAETSYMRKRWGGALDCDPCYNPNLTTSSEDFSMNAQPVRSQHHGYPLKIS